MLLRKRSKETYTSTVNLLVPTPVCKVIRNTDRTAQSLAIPSTIQFF